MIRRKSGRLVVWDLDPLRKVRDIRQPGYDPDSVVRPLAISPDGTLAASSTSDHVHVTDLRTGTQTHSFMIPPDPSSRGLDWGAESLKFLDGRRLLIYRDGHKVYDLSTRRVISLEVDHGIVDDVVLGGDGVTFLGVGAEPRTFVATWTDGSARPAVVNYDFTRGRDGTSQDSPASQIMPGGRTARLIANSSEVIIWDVASGREVATLRSRYGVGTLLDLPSGLIVNLGYTYTRTSSPSALEIFSADGRTLGHQIIDSRMVTDSIHADRGSRGALVYTSRGLLIMLTRPFRSTVHDNFGIRVLELR
ncbi:hypothetical protein DFJ69_6219 [Thermomonospora umbrina]|uniref:WD40 repeat protein n=1 Tax=Thermomonospora umbrina TaxID=111806 RepID=A0A3D9SXH8_9ACTN|nr:hypothetical protein DFJ69_6219 [Thermomonospora umbrina]